MATDPVCYMVVDEENAQYKSTYKGAEYYFCCDYCRKQFDANPKKYSRVVPDMNIDTPSC